MENKIGILQKHINECKEILAKNNPKEAAEIIETIGRAYYYENDDFGIRPAHDKFGNTIYESSENLKNLKCLITQMEIRLGEYIDENSIQTQEKSSSTINNIQLGNNNKIINSNINNEIVDTKNSNHKISMIRQIIVGVIVAIVAGVILFYLGIQ
ncbi:hypothetical protein [Helicobacter sp. T3_23-1056]